jgi:hypothetical protein
MAAAKINDSGSKETAKFIYRVGLHTLNSKTEMRIPNTAENPTSLTNATMCYIQ